ncbi:IS6 family transposase [Oligoflexus sp.]|uniref:IS6 family transposase n=1 Tax=Oligoflexus sp. TaxID=1971216 RepID=UPI0039C95038
MLTLVGGFKESTKDLPSTKPKQRSSCRKLQRNDQISLHIGNKECGTGISKRLDRWKPDEPRGSRPVLRGALDETPGSTHPYIKVKGQWKYLYRAVDKEGNTVDYLLTAMRDRKAAQRFLSRAFKLNDQPIKITIDKSGANVAGIQAHNEGEGTDIEIRQNKYLNNIIEQDHRPIKQLCRATLGFGSFRMARITIGGFESMRIIRKRQIEAEGDTSAEIFYSIAA